MVGINIVPNSIRPIIKYGLTEHIVSRLYGKPSSSEADGFPLVPEGIG